MTGTQYEGHIFRRFDNEMQHLHSLVLEMGHLAVAQLQSAAVTLREKDPAAARTVIENDKKINDLDIKADDEIVRIVALRQPMAGDLREIIAVSKIIAELERAGDEARKIAALTIRFYGKPAPAKAGGGKSAPAPSGDALNDIHALATEVEKMLTAVMAAFDDLNLKTAQEVLHNGLKLDEQLSGILHRLSTAIINPDNPDRQHFVDLVLGIRALERFGGHAVNIAGHLVFIKHGLDVRHGGVEFVLARLKEIGEG